MDASSSVSSVAGISSSSSDKLLVLYGALWQCVRVWVGGTVALSRAQSVCCFTLPGVTPLATNFRPSRALPALSTGPAGDGTPALRPARRGMEPPPYDLRGGGWN